MSQAESIVESGIARRDPDRELTKALGEVSAVLQRRAFDLVARVKRLEEETLAELEKWTPTERLLTVAEAAVYLGFSTRTVSKWTSGRVPKLPFILIQGQKRLRLSELKLWLEQRTFRPRQIKL